MRLTVLGSGTLLPDAGRHSAAHLVETADGARVLLDCGAGTVHGFDRYGVDWRRLTHVCVSHFHTDHVGDLAALFWALRHGLGEAGRSEPLHVLGPPGIADHLRALTAAHGDFVADPGFPVSVVEMAREDTWSGTEPELAFRTCPTPHTEASVAWRVETVEGVVGYTGDTGPSAEVARFLRGAAALVCECSVPDPLEMDNHLSPATVAELLAVARPELALLTHLYPPLHAATVPDLVRAAGYHGRVAVARDGSSVGIGPDGVADPVGRSASPDTP